MALGGSTVAEGFPVQKVAITNLALIIAFLITGLVLTLTGHADQANGAFGTATGLVVGGGATSIIINSALKNGTVETATTSTPEPPKP